MSIWTWLIRYRVGTSTQQKLFDLVSEGLDHLNSDPDYAIDCFDKGQVLAEQADEPWLVLFYQHWKLQALIFRKGDFNRALDLAVQAAVEVRKPIYVQLPQRVCLHEDLIHTYVGIDPDGYGSGIEKALKYMDNEISRDVECWKCHLSLYVGLPISLEKWEEALPHGLRYLAECEGGVHESSALVHLCEIAFELGEWDKLSKWAEKGEKAARKDERELALPKLLAWRAVATRHHGDEKAARRFYQMATSKASHLGAILPQAYYKALSAYHQIDGDFELALKVRQRELETLTDKGQTIAEYYCRRDCCRLLAKLKQPYDAPLLEAQKVARHLKNPEKYLAELAQIG